MVCKHIGLGDVGFLVVIAVVDVSVGWKLCVSRELLHMREGREL